jgi:serine/threonine-protein kinase
MAALAADHNLLFGLLALQVGLIDQGQLVAAFQAWTRDKARALADHLGDRGGLDTEQRAGVEAMVALHLKKHGGDVDRSLAAVPANRSTRASLADLGEPLIEAMLARVAQAKNGRATEADVEDDPDRTAGLSVGRSSDDGQRFRLLRPHARGGLGEVFVALDAELHREVALKQILESHADDPDSRQRFVAEAEITGGLEHPGIVPVYGLGTYAGGRPYYAMRFIKGDSLKEAIERFHGRVGTAHQEGADGEDTVVSAHPTGPGLRSLELRKLLRRFLDVCNAIDYAHSRGVIHRDIKPANIILGKHGETLVVDWGLAKAIGRADPSVGEQTIAPSTSGSSETMPGSALGTPPYISPEQAAGNLDRLGPRSDVYSLGATLYCLLTSKPPFEGDDIGEILRRVQAGDFRSPREVDPSLDKALDAVCKKAMATKPEDRYASGRALAEDIERWSADEPVSAWREPLSRRAQRWARRNRSPVTAAAAAVLVALAGLGAVLAVQRGSNQALAAKNAALDRANISLREAIQQKDAANAALGEANGRVQARFDLAREAIRSFKAGVEEEAALKEDRLRPLRDKLLGSARRFYDRLGELLRGQSDAGSKAVLAESYAELGELIDTIGQKPEAREAYRKAVAIRRELAAEGAGASVRVALARALSALGEEARQLGDHAGALAAHEEARSLAEALATGPGATIEARRALGLAYFRAGQAQASTGADGRALAAYRRAREMQESLVRGAAAVPDDRLALAETMAEIGGLLERTGGLAAALVQQREALEIKRALAAEHPDVPEYRRGLADSHANVGDLLAKTGDLAGALAEQRRFQELFRALAAEHPAVAEYRHDLAVSHNRVGVLRETTGDLAGALAEQRRFQELMQALAAEHPALPDYQRELAVSHGRVGALLEKTGDLAGALVEQRKNQELFLALAVEHPDVPKYRSDLAVSHNQVGGLLERTGDLARALAEQRRYQELVRALAAEHPTVPDYRRDLAVSHSRIGGLLEKTGDLAGALAEYRKAQEQVRALAAEHPAVPDYGLGLAISHSRVGGLLTMAGKPALALPELESARCLLEDLARAGPNVPDYRDFLAAALNAAGGALRDLRRPGEARDSHARAVALAEGLASAYPKAPVYRARLADGLRLRAGLELAAGDAAGAVADASRAVALLEAQPARDGRQWFTLACARTTLAAAAGRDGTGPSTAESSGLADRAIDDLRRAAAMGYRSPAAYRYEPALGPLRGRDDFRLLMMDVTFPAEPFAR